MKTLYKSEQSGRSMVEMLGVLAIIGVLSVGGIAGYSKAMAKFKTSKALDQVSTTVAKVAYNAFNGEVTISATTVSGRANAGFTLVFSGLSKEACVQMASSDWGSGSGSGLVSVQAGTATAGTTASGTLPLNLATAAGGCNQEGDANKVTWVYY